MIVSLAAVLVLPTLVVTWGRWNGDVLFTSYREPKLAALVVGAFVLAAMVAWRAELQRRDLLTTARQPAVALLLAVVAWSAVSVAWAPVTEHAVFELLEWLPAVIVFVVAVAWSRRRFGVPRALVGCLVGAATVCSVVGWLQLAAPIEILLPIRPEAGVRAPSLMGYRNPMAHLIGGQLIIASGLWVELLRRRSSRRWCLALGVAIAVQAAYLAQLQSRTAMVAAVVGLAVFAGASALLGRDQRWGRQVLIVVLTVAALLAVVVAMHPAARGRAVSVARYVASPSLYLESDRGVYAANTLEMVLDRPLGAGAGNWFVLYPVYRVHGRDVGFLEGVQVRRAHSDHVQIVGELGWIGGALWVGFLSAVAVAAIRGARAEASPFAVGVAAQWVALLVTMATDYSMELPVLRVQMVAVAAVALSLRTWHPAPENGRASHGRRWLVRIAVVGCGVGVAMMAGHHVVRDAAFHRAHALYNVMMRELRSTDDPREQRQVFAVLAPAIREAAESWTQRPGLDSGAVMLPALMADVELIGGRLGQSLEWADSTLALHPYYPNIVRTLAIAHRRLSPDRARLYHMIWEHLRYSDRPGYGLPVEPRAVGGLGLDDVRTLLRELDVNRSTFSSSVTQGSRTVGALPSSSPVTTGGGPKAQGGTP
jgi:hypothetical protein